MPRSPAMARPPAAAMLEKTSAMSCGQSAAAAASSRAFMFEPRPEIRTATRARSAMMGRGPGVTRAPRIRSAGDGAALLTGFDRADDAGALACFGQCRAHCLRLGRRDDRDHADPAVEGPRELARLDVALCLEEGDQRGLGPCAGVDPGMETLRQDARNIFEQPAAGDVGEGVDLAGANERQQRA